MTTTTRFYYSSTTAAAVSPAFDSDWAVTASAVRRKLKTAPAATGASGAVAAAETSAGVVDVLNGQFISDSNVLPAGPIAGTFDSVMSCRESGTGQADMFQQIRIHVFDSTGATKRGTLFDGLAQTSVSATASDPNGEFGFSIQETRILSGIAIVPGTTAQAGDRLVVEFGCRACNLSTTSRTSTIDFRDDVVADHALTAGLTTNGRPWLELHLTDPPNTPTGLTADPDCTAIDLDWTASTGSPTGYEVRVNGGAATDVGNVLTHNFTGLTPDTAYTLEVRAYNGGGFSAWASIMSTTDGPPDDPTGLDATTTTTTATLTWDASTGAPAGYDVRIDGGSPIDIGNVLTYDFTGLTPGTTYTLEVRAYNAGGDSGWSSIEATTGAAGAGYVADITVGDHSWIIESGDPAEGDVLVLDGLSIGWEVSESDPWPAQPSSVGCKLALWTNDVADLSDVVIGTPFHVVLTDVSTNVFGTFHGRVARQVGNSRRAGPNGLGMLYTLNGVDYTVDLAELPVLITEEWPAESADARFARIAAAVLAAGGVVIDVPADTGTAAFEALPPAATNALALLTSHLEQVAIDTGDGPQRYIVTPVVVADVLDRFSCVLLERVVDAALLPGTLDVVDGVLVLLFPNLNADGVVDAGAVELDTTWNRLKYRAVNQVTVSGESVTAAATRAGPPVRLTLPTTLTDQDAADLMAALYLPDVDETNGWVADTFTLHAVDTGYKLTQPEALVPAWFPDHRDDPASTSVYVMPLAIVGIPAAINLAGDLPVYAGQLVKVNLTLSRERVLMEFALRRQLPASSGAEAVTWEWILDTFPTLTWEDVDPDLSWYDARLARRP